jgi:cyclopropane fatty-acyl-phospholipid synthase-like methyltransferase
MSKAEPPLRTVSGFGGETAARLGNAFWEKALGISTRGVVDVDYTDAVHYASMPYATIWNLLRQLELGPDDTFVDVGCGRGRVLCCAARRPISEAIGVEVSAPLCADARANADRLRGRKAAITVHNAPAQDFDYSAATVLFLFNPFGPDTMDQVLAKLRADTAGGSLRIAYAVPTYADVFKDHDWLEPYRPATAKQDDREWVAFFRTATGG